MKFDILAFPMVILLYLPYNIFWLNYDTSQLEKWVLTSAIMFVIANLVLTPYYALILRKIGLKPQ